MPDSPSGVVVPAETELPRTGLDRLRADEELYQHVPENPAEWAQYGMAADGLPKPVTPTVMPFAPPLTTSNCVCLADHSSFVVRDRTGYLLASFSPEEVTRTPDGRYWVPAALAARRTPTFGRLLALAFCTSAAPVPDEETKQPVISFEVKPVRPQCRHFVRQMTDLSDNTDHVFLARLCTARRDDGGEFLSIRDSQIFACDMRDPRDESSSDRIEQFDRNKIALGEERAAESDAFDIDAHLDQMLDQADAAADGIFSERPLRR
jgi:hypothetical protein